MSLSHTLSIISNGFKCTHFKIWISHKTRTFSRLFHSHKMLLSALLTSTGKNRTISTHEMEIRIPEYGKILLMESGLQLKESGIPLTIWILESKFCEQRLESSTWNLASKTVLESFTRADTSYFWFSSDISKHPNFKIARTVKVLSPASKRSLKNKFLCKFSTW